MCQSFIKSDVESWVFIHIYKKNHKNHLLELPEVFNGKATNLRKMSKFRDISACVPR